MDDPPILGVSRTDSVAFKGKSGWQNGGPLGWHLRGWTLNRIQHVSADNVQAAAADRNVRRWAAAALARLRRKELRWRVAFPFMCVGLVPL